MRTESRKKFEEYTRRLAELNSVGDASKKFTVTPSVQQTLEKKIQESSGFLSKVNIVGVPELSGQKIGLGVSGTIAGRTNVGAGPRVPRDVSSLEDHDYQCKFTEFDTSIGYAKIDMWAKFPDFQAKLRDAIIQQQALDRIMIGFNGTSAAAATNRSTSPLLQDVNIGWLQQYRAHASERVMSEVIAESDEVRVGKVGDYENLDALVEDAVNNLIDPWHQENTGLVVIVGRKLLADKYFPIINKDQPNTEALAGDLIISQKRIGGLPAVRVPFMINGAMLITTLENLSIYYQESGRRRHIVERPDYNDIANFESSNDAYVIEDYGMGCLIENIVLDDFTPVVP